MDSRLGARQRGYDRTWERATAQFRWRNPWCAGCLAIGVKCRASIVDHVVPHKGDTAKFWDMGNWQSLCGWHHDAIKPVLERLYLQGKISAAELKLTSQTAVKLTRERHRPAVGLDGFAIPGS